MYVNAQNGQFIRTLVTRLARRGEASTALTLRTIGTSEPTRPGGTGVRPCSDIRK